jgi:hypothetical protein
MGLEKAVLITVISLPKLRSHYKHYFRNFLCFTHSYEYDLVVYITRQQGDDYKTHMKKVHELSKLGVKALPFPEEMFWLFVYGKSTPIYEGKKHVPWKGDSIDFLNYGALVMLMPTYEVLKAGYTCLYMDVDIALIVDPVPHMILGDSDFVASIENKECQEHFMASNPFAIPWDNVEPNTGISLVRPTKQGLTFYLDWLEALVDSNMGNDQQVFDKGFRRFHDMTYASNCLPPNTPGVKSGPSIRYNKNSATYCFLSDLIFQNGFTALTCSKSHYMGSYTHNMVNYGIPGSEVHGPESRPFALGTSPGIHRDKVTGITPEENIDNKYYMATVHVNFSGGKSDELNKRGLWLYSHTNNSENDTLSLEEGMQFHPMMKPNHTQSGSHQMRLERHHHNDKHLSCYNYNITEGHYTKHMHNFTEYYIGYNVYVEKEFVKLNKPGQLMKRRTGQMVYLLGNDSLLHGFPNGATFMKMGFEFDKVSPVPEFIFHKFTIGDDLPDATSKKIETIETAPVPLILTDIKHVPGSMNEPFNSPNIDYLDKRFGNIVISKGRHE